MSDERFEAWFTDLSRGESPDLKPWERVNLLEYLAARPGDAADVAERLLVGPIPSLRLNDLLSIATAHRNEKVALRVLRAGAEVQPILPACEAGLAELVAALIERGARINRRFLRDRAPLHAAAASVGAEATVRVLIDACCDLTARTDDGQFAWDLAGEPLASELRAAVGQHGPQWFREAQLHDIDHYAFVRDGAMFGFNPNDVQTPIWTGNEDEGFGWPNSVAQARELLHANRVLYEEVTWFLPFLGRIEAGEDFSLDELGARVPRRREPSWR